MIPRYLYAYLDIIMTWFSTRHANVEYNANAVRTNTLRIFQNKFIQLPKTFPHYKKTMQPYKP